MWLLVRFFKGGLLYTDTLKMKFKSDVMDIYDIYELQSTEEEVVSDLSYDDKGNKKTLPSQESIRETTLQRIVERRKE